MVQDENTKWGKLRKVSYLIKGYADLEDVISSVNKMIETNAPEAEYKAIKKNCHISAIVLPKRTTEVIVHLWIPEKVFG